MPLVAWSHRQELLLDSKQVLTLFSLWILWDCWLRVLLLMVEIKDLAFSEAHWLHLGCLTSWMILIEEEEVGNFFDRIVSWEVETGDRKTSLALAQNSESDGKSTT